jgi:hypothetical protein
MRVIVSAYLNTIYGQIPYEKTVSCRGIRVRKSPFHI